MRKNELLVVVIRQDLVRVARATGCPQGVAPSSTKYGKMGRFGVVKVRAAVGGYDYFKAAAPAPKLGWTEAMHAYGLEGFKEAARVTEGELIEDLRRVARICGRGPKDMPTVMEYQEHGRHSWMTIYRRLGGGDPPDGTWWNAAMYAKLDPVWSAPKGSLAPNRIVQDYRRVADRLGYEPEGKGPSRREFDRAVPYSATTAGWHFGGWSEFVEAAGFEPRTPANLRGCCA